MSDLISKDTLISKLEEKIKTFDDRIERRSGPCYHDESGRIDALNNRALAYEEIVKMIQDSPTVYAVSVVRCGECKYYVDCEGGLCTHPKLQSDETPPTQKDRSCSYGERKDGESDV